MDKQLRRVERASGMTPCRGVHDNRDVPKDADPFERFRAVVFNDTALQRQLREIVDWDAFVAEVIAAAAVRGIELTREDLDEERRQAQLAWRDRWV